MFQVKYPDSEDRELTPIVAKTVILPFVTPALIAPESYGMVDQPIGPKERKNLAAIAHLIGCIASPDVAPTQDRFVRVPLAEYIQKESAPFRDWVLDGAQTDPSDYCLAAELANKPQWRLSKRWRHSLKLMSCLIPRSRPNRSRSPGKRSTGP